MPHIYRVVVRGEFADLTDAQRAELVAAAPAHDIFSSAFTADGTFTYGPEVHAFSFRYEVREPDDGRAPAECGAAAEARALSAAATYLDERGWARKRVRATVTDMADMWRDRP